MPRREAPRERQIVGAAVQPLVGRDAQAQVHFALRHLLVGGNLRTVSPAWPRDTRCVVEPLPAPEACGADAFQFRGNGLEADSLVSSAATARRPGARAAPGIAAGGRAWPRATQPTARASAPAPGRGAGPHLGFSMSIRSCSSRPAGRSHANRAAVGRAHHLEHPHAVIARHHHDLARATSRPLTSRSTGSSGERPRSIRRRARAGSARPASGRSRRSAPTAAVDVEDHIEVADQSVAGFVCPAAADCAAESGSTGACPLPAVRPWSVPSPRRRRPR